MNKIAFITGITGQDGSYLADLLIEKDYIVYGLVRRSSLFNRARIEHIINGKKSSSLKLLYGDLGDSSALNRILEKVNPDEIYNLGAQSHVQISFEIPEYTSDVNGLGTLRLLDAIKEVEAKASLDAIRATEVRNIAVSPVAATLLWPIARLHDPDSGFRLCSRRAMVETLRRHPSRHMAASACPIRGDHIAPHSL